MPITLFDGILIGIVLASALLAMIRGFSRELFLFITLIASVAAAYYFYPSLVPFALEYTDQELIAKVGSGAVIFLGTYVVVSLITSRIADFIIDSSIGALDRTLGFVYGAARGVLIMVVAVQFLNGLVASDVQPDWISQAKSKPLLNSLGEQLVNMLPENADTAIIDRLSPSS